MADRDTQATGMAGRLHAALERIRTEEGGKHAHLVASENLARWFGMSPRQALRVLVGEGVPSMEHVRNLLERCGEPRLRRVFVDALLTGTDMVAVDMDRERVRATTAGQMVTKCGDMLRAVETAWGDGHISDDEMGEIAAGARDVAEAALQLEARVRLERVEARKAARPMQERHEKPGPRLARSG